MNHCWHPIKKITHYMCCNCEKQSDQEILEFCYEEKMTIFSKKPSIKFSGPKWNSWSFGVYWGWQKYIRFVSFDFGPGNVTFWWREEDEEE